MNMTIVLCLLLTVDLAAGYFCLKRQTALFIPMNDIGLPAWIATYGRHNPAATWWFYLLFLLLAVLACNTFACTTQRLVLLLKAKERFGRLRLLLKLAPHIIHYALLIILLGYLASYLLAEVEPGRTLVPGASFTLSDGSGRITLIEFQPEYAIGERLSFLTGQVITPKARMLLSDGVSTEEKILAGNQPIYFRGYCVYLSDYAPKTKSNGMKMKVRVDLLVRRDPGVPLYFVGMFLFTLGLLLYIYEWLFYREVATQ